jgi:two-component system, LytTR family, sensor kinase
MKRPFVFLIHLGYWLIYLVLLLLIFTIATTQIRKAPAVFSFSFLFPFVLLSIVPNLLSFYASYFFLFSRFLFRKKIVGLVISGGLVCLLAAFAGDLIALVWLGFDQPVFTDAKEFVTLTVSFFLVAAVHGVVALVIRGFIAWYTEIKLKEELARKTFETELMLIKSQINPHFLFNTINNIDVLITRDPVKASAYLNKLSDILRYMVYETKNERIPLARELDYLEKYLALQKIRTVNPDYVNFRTTGAAGNLTIAPMILFPFIENAFKHTENKKNSNTIRIRVAIEKDKIVFECENSYQTTAHRKRDFGGRGNELVKKRLMLMYPEKHALEVDAAGGIYRVNLTLL